jgi:uncharacterized membrane protein
MSPLAIILVLLSASIHVGWNLVTKSSASPLAFSLLKGSILMLLAIIILPFIPLGSIPMDVWTYIAFSGVIHAVYILSLSTAYETGDMSYVYPIARSAPAFVPIVAFLALGETISLRGCLGIAIVVTCVLFIQLRGGAGSELKRLWVSLKQRDSRWAFTTLGSVVAYTLVDKAGMVTISGVTEITSGMHGPIFFMLETVVCYLLFWAYMICCHKLSIGLIWKNEWSRAVAAAIGTMASYSLILHVMQTEIVSYIVTLRQSSVLMAIVIGSTALKEPYGRHRFIAAVGMLIGFFLVATAN